MRYTETAGQPGPCAQCGAQVPSTLLVCPSCGALMKAPELKRLAATAQAARDRNDVTAEIGAWRSALELLPPGSDQHNHVLARVTELSKLLDSGKAGKPLPPPPPPPPGASPTGAASPPPPPPVTYPAAPTTADAAKSNAKKSGIGAAIAIVATILFKSKALVVIILTKGKLLLAGLTKGSTFYTMLLSCGVYWTLWGWKFAVGLVIGIYIHEMGHVAALHRLGIKATAPVFIPGIGALVRLKQYPADAREDARIGLAGPIWGLGASVAAFAIFVITGAPIWAAIARVNAWINLFNLIPISPLDGGRGFRALLRWQRGVVAALFAAGYVATHDGLFILLAIVAAVMTLKKGEAGIGDKRTFIEYAVLIIALSALIMVEVPGLELR